MARYAITIQRERTVTTSRDNWTSIRQLPAFTVEAASGDEAEQKAAEIAGGFVRLYIEDGERVSECLHVTAVAL